MYIAFFFFFFFCRPVARIFRRGVTCVSDVNACVYICKSREVWGHAPPRKILEIRCSEIASEAILGPVVATWLAEYCIQLLAVHVCIW